MIAAYHTAIRPIGNAVSGDTFTDKKLTFQNSTPSEAKWGQKKREFTDAARLALKLPDTITLATQPTWAYWKGLADLARDQDNLRNNPDLGLIDPFVVNIEVKDSQHADTPAWRVVTQFADSGCGYIKKIFNGAQELGGGIATAGRFNAAKNDDAAATGTDYLYSSTHEQGAESFDDRMGTMAPDQEKVGGNAKGLDAVTWLAAEGACFAPVAALGAAGSPESRYVIKPNAGDWTGYKFLTATDLMQCWGERFERKYNVSAQKMAEVIGAHGKTTEAQPPAGAHYNLTTGVRHDQG